jgi:tRNA A-37 threonylcarbamoyl transferase component Bud32
MIPQYGNYYAPILNSCSADPQEIIQEERDYCHLFASGKYDHFATSRMRYVGDDTLLTYLDQQAFIGNDLEEEIKGVYETHKHLLKALSKLLDARDPIVHYDLKDSNVVYDAANNVPIIIDFGMSFTKSELFSALVHPEKLHQFFWNYQAKEDNSVDINWPIEVEVLSYINKYKDLNQDITSSDIEELKSVIHRFIKKDLTYNHVDTIKFQSQMKHYLSSYKLKNWENLTQDLINTWHTWDNYGISFTYYKYLQRKSSRFTNNSFIVKYSELIEKMVFATPETRRFGPKETIRMLSEIWRSYSGIDNSKK